MVNEDFFVLFYFIFLHRHRPFATQTPAFVYNRQFTRAYRPPSPGIYNDNSGFEFEWTGGRDLPVSSKAERNLEGTLFIVQIN